MDVVEEDIVRNVAVYKSPIEALSMANDSALFQ
jgi:hypothetical protein